MRPLAVQAYDVITTRHLTAKVRVFLDYLLQHLGQYPPSVAKMQDLIKMGGYHFTAELNHYINAFT